MKDLTHRPTTNSGVVNYSGIYSTFGIAILLILMLTLQS